MMKRRNVESSKYRKQFHFRKYKFAESMYSRLVNFDGEKFPPVQSDSSNFFSSFNFSNTFLYLKFLFTWMLIMIADFMLDFRFEFLWPFWLLIRSLHDSFKYQGVVSFFLSQLKTHACLILTNCVFFLLDILCFFRFNCIFIRHVLLHFSTGSVASFHR
jgi:hypothetical protein